jgi:hypothetical protein
MPFIITDSIWGLVVTGYGSRQHAFGFIRTRRARDIIEGALK